MREYKIREAVHWLRKYKARREGLISYVNPMIYTEDRCQKIIWESTDDEIRAAGFDVQEVRELARPPVLFEYLMKNGVFS